MYSGLLQIHVHLLSEVNAVHVPYTAHVHTLSATYVHVSEYFKIDNSRSWVYLKVDEDMHLL